MAAPSRAARLRWQEGKYRAYLKSERKSLLRPNRAAVPSGAPGARGMYWMRLGIVQKALWDMTAAARAKAAQRRAAPVALPQAYAREHERMIVPLLLQAYVALVVHMPVRYCASAAMRPGAVRFACTRLLRRAAAAVQAAATAFPAGAVAPPRLRVPASDCAGCRDALLWLHSSGCASSA